MSDNASFPGGSSQALLYWLLFVVVFIFFGGAGAGATALVYQLIFQDQFSDVLYAVIFGANGYIAYRLAQQLLAQRKS